MFAEQPNELKQLLIIDHASSPYAGEMLFPFAAEELLCRAVGAGKLPAVVYFWRHVKGLVLGLRDRRLPFAKEAIQSFEQSGFQVAVRHSGGAAVPLDDGVVNVSLIFPKPKGRIDFHDDFETMYSLIKRSVMSLAPNAGVSVAKGEIAESFCPGDYDISIGGKKFCGLAQRRQTLGIAVQAFVLACGSGKERAMHAIRYYDQAAQGHPGLDHPRVSPNSMASLEELIGLADEDSFIRAVKRELRSRYPRIEEKDEIPLQAEDIHAMVGQLKRRYA